MYTNPTHLHQYGILPEDAGRESAHRLTQGDDIYFVSDTGGYVIALGGSDHVIGGYGDDVISGGLGEDALEAGRGSDALFGGGGNDGLLGGLGRDRLFGGDGGDSLFGAGGSDRLVGGRGADSLDMGRSVDGRGPDHSRDRAIFFSLEDSTPGSGGDIIHNFDPSRDRIDLHRIDADALTLGNQAFHFIGGTAFSGTAGELRYANDGPVSSYGLLTADVDGDGQPDFLVTLSGHPDVHASDFVL